jgi:hypothetical protein
LPEGQVGDHDGRPDAGPGTHHAEQLVGGLAPEVGKTNRLFRGVRGLVARLLRALGRRVLEPAGCGGALRTHLRPASLDADHGGASAGVPWVALLGRPARGSGAVSAARRGKYSPKNSLKTRDQALALLPPPATSRIPHRP